MTGLGLKARAGHTDHPPMVTMPFVRSAVAALCTLLMTAAWIGPARASDKPIPAEVRALYVLADLETNVETFCDAVTDTAHQSALSPSTDGLSASIEPGLRPQLEAAIRRASDPTLARERALASFALGYDAEAARAVSHFYSSEAGQEILALERKAQHTDWEAEIDPFIASLSAAPVPVERVALLARLATATHASEDAAQLQASAAGIVAHAARVLLPVDSRPSEQALDASVTSLRRGLIHQMNGQLSVVLMFVYREASDEVLEAYVDFAESMPARWLFSNHRMSMIQLAAEMREQAVSELSHPASPR